MRIQFRNATSCNEAVLMIIDANVHVGSAIKGSNNNNNNNNNPNDHPDIQGIQQYNCSGKVHSVVFCSSVDAAHELLYRIYAFHSFT